MYVFFIWNLVHEGKYQGRYFCFQMVMMADIIVKTALLYTTKKTPKHTHKKTPKPNPKNQKQS